MRIWKFENVEIVAGYRLQVACSREECKAPNDKRQEPKKFQLKNPKP